MCIRWRFLAVGRVVALAATLVVFNASLGNADNAAPMPPQVQALPQAQGIDVPKAQAALEQFVREWNAASQAFVSQPQTEKDKALLDSEMGILPRLSGSSSLAAFNEIVTPLGQRFAERGFDAGRLDAADKALLDAIAACGLKLYIGEGMAYFDLDNAKFSAVLMPYASQDVQDFIRQDTSMETRVIEDMGLACSLDDLAAMALQWERFIKAHPGSAILDAAHKKYDSLMELMLWCDLDNTPALTRQGILKAGWLRELRAAAEKYKGTETGRIIKNYVLTIGKKDGKLDSALRKSTLGAIARVGR